jgi:FkbM family methyltransferase
LNTEQKIRLAAFLSRVVRGARTLAGKPDLATFSRGGIDWELDLRQGIDFAIFLQGGFEPMTLREYGRLVKAGDTVFDIGANIGAHTLPLARLVGPHGTVAAFEPTDYAFSKLRRNLALNPLFEQRIIAVQALLVSKTEDQKPQAIPSSWSLEAPLPGDNIHPVHKGSYNSLQGATAIQLDQWVDESHLDRLDFIKIDVDGFEIDVLEGAKKTLKRFRPRIMMEFAPYVFEERGRSFAELMAFLQMSGYLARHVHGGILNLSPSLEKSIPRGGSINVILDPP